MTRKIYFGRHGRVGGDGDHVTIYGMRELSLIRDRLEMRGFKGDTAVSSTEIRCIETACFLTYDSTPVAESALHTYGNMADMTTMPTHGEDPHHESGRDYATRVFDSLLAHQPEETDLVVISHDAVPVLLAWRFLEINGKSVSWGESLFRPNGLFFPDQGEGLLVEGTDYELFMHPRILG